MPDSLFGMPFFLGLAIVCFAIVVLIGIFRGGGGGARSGPGVPAKSGSNMLQTVAAVTGILSFLIQVLEWFKII